MQRAQKSAGSRNLIVFPELESGWYSARHVGKCVAACAVESEIAWCAFKVALLKVVQQFGDEG
ncbi:hypothetical protein EES42_43995 [Streptomyces sp. ADI95-17]|uniref:hypothetical protein n=1 Tax=Streptomyces sp. NBC_01553 TaxID=2975877 RepID=UPI000FA5CF01|nr:hypothetical protein EES42_43995 [Streptomyces sp. ADI95-17]